MAKSPNSENGECNEGFEDAAAVLPHKPKAVTPAPLAPESEPSNEPPAENDETPAKKHLMNERVGQGPPDLAFTAEHVHKITNGNYNYVIPFGLPGSGKTTFLASFFKYINESQYLDSEIVSTIRGEVQTSADFAGQAMINNWQRLFDLGDFLGSTEVGELGIRKLSYKVTPNIGQKTPFTFSVIEVSGEDLVKVIADVGRVPKLPKAIEAVFKNKCIRTSIVLVIHPNKLENDELFHNLYQWLKSNLDAHRLNNFSLVIMIANPTLAREILLQKRPDTEDQDEDEWPFIYLKEYTPMTYAIYNGWAKTKRVISLFKVGDIKPIETKDGPIDRIDSFDSRSAYKVFEWMYHQFTGKELGRTKFQKIIKWLGE